MLKIVVVLVFVAVATAAPAIRLPVLDESLIEQAYIEDAEEARHRILVQRPIPDIYPIEVVREDDAVFEGSEPHRHRRSTDEEVLRERRSLQPGAPDYGVGQQQQQDRNWGADVRRDGPNTKVIVNGKHSGGGYDVDGEWSKVIRGPGKAKPDWRIGVRW